MRGVDLDNLIDLMPHKVDQKYVLEALRNINEHTYVDDNIWRSLVIRFCGGSSGQQENICKIFKCMLDNKLNPPCDLLDKRRFPKALPLIDIYESYYFDETSDEPITVNELKNIKLNILNNKNRLKVLKRFDKTFDLELFMKFSDKTSILYFPEILNSYCKYTLELLKQITNNESFDYVLSRLDPKIKFTNNDIMMFKKTTPYDNKLVSHYKDTPTLKFIYYIDKNPIFNVLNKYIDDRLLYIADNKIEYENPNAYIINELSCLEDIVFIINKARMIILSPDNIIELGMAVYKYSYSKCEIYTTGDSAPFEFIKKLTI